MMKLTDDTPYKVIDDEEVAMTGYREIEEEAEISSPCLLEIQKFPHQQQRRLIVVGYALTSKKIKSFLQPKLQGLARNKGILFVAIDQNRPLSEQGPFDIVLHKKICLGNMPCSANW